MSAHPPHVIMATETTGWCFEHIAKVVTAKLWDEFSFSIAPFSTLVRGDCDVLVSMYWTTALLLRSRVKGRSLMTCLYDHKSWRNSEQAIKQLSLVLRHSDILGVCNRVLLREVEAAIVTMNLPDGPPQVVLIEDGVDTNLFRYSERLPREFCVGWTGNSTRHTPGGPVDQKGLGLLKGAATKAHVPLHILDAASGAPWPHEEMPDFYKGISCYVCASDEEGTPNPVLEALSSGRPVISTKVGVATSAIQDGVNGFLVDRDPDAIAAAIQRVASLPREELERMSRAARQTAVSAWDWGTKAESYRQAFRTCLTRAAQRDAMGPATPPPRQSVKVPVKVQEAPHRAQQPSAAPATPPAAAAPPPPAPAPSSTPAPSPAPATVPSPAPTVTPEPVDRVNVTGPAPIEPVQPRPHEWHTPPTVLCISDVPGWAFDQNLQDMALYLKDKYRFSFWYIKHFQQTGVAPDMDAQDAVFCPYHRWGIGGLLPWERTLGSLRAYWFFPERPATPGAEEFELVNRFGAFHVVTLGNYEQLREACPNVVYLTNPVNMDRFDRITPVEGEVICAWNGNARHYLGSNESVDVKGFYGYVLPATSAAGVPLEFAEYHTRRLTPAQMPAFYQRANLSICASLYEGASNSVMESMASGHAIITTDVGNAREMQRSQLQHIGETGIVILRERSVDGLTQAIKELKADPARVRAMGRINREEIDKRWSWKAWAPAYDQFIRSVLP